MPFSSAYSVKPTTITVAIPSPRVITYEYEDLDNEEPLHHWYTPIPSKIASLIPQSINTTTTPKRKVAWSSETKLLATDEQKKLDGFQLGMDLMYCDRQGNNLLVVYEGAIADGLLHICCLADSSKLTTPLNYRKEVRTGLSQQEEQELARLQTIIPLQQEFMSWNHRLYNVLYHTIFRLASIGYFPKRLLKFQNNTSLFMEFQFGKAHRRPRRIKGKKTVSISTPDQKEPGDGLVPRRDPSCKEIHRKVIAQAGQYVKHYYNNIRRFADNGFVDAINSKSHKFTFCGVGAHHQNGIIENKKKILNTGAQTLLIHGIIMWPKMIDDMFWLFSMKDISEWLNSLQVDILGRTPESKVHDIKVQEVLVKPYYTVLCPTYMLDARIQSAGVIGLPKWELLLRIGVYIGHSLFHASSIELLWNPIIDRVIPQYYVVFDDNFTTVSYMEAGTLPPNWEDLIKYYSEVATTKDIDLADT